MSTKLQVEQRARNYKIRKVRKAFALMREVIAQFGLIEGSSIAILDTPGGDEQYCINNINGLYGKQP